MIITLPPDLAERYREPVPLGQGGMGQVVSAFDTRLERRVAIKFISGLEDALQVRRFVDEARLLAKLEHPNVVRIFDFGVAGAARPYITMECLEGSALEALVGAGRYDAARTESLLSALLDGLAFVHERGVLHRDIKPANIFVRTDGTPLLIDFGLSRSEEDSNRTRLTEAGVVVGTPAFMPPEALEGTAQTPLWDQFSLALSIVRVWKGADLHVANELGPSDQLQRILSSLSSRTYFDEARKVLAGRTRLESALLRALTPEPERRFPDARAMRAALEPGPAVARGPAGRTPSAPRTPVTKSSTTARVTSGRVLGACALLGALGLAMVAGRPPAAPIAASPTAAPALALPRVGILDLRIRTLARHAQVFGHTAVPVALKATCLPEGAGTAVPRSIVETQPSFVHRLSVSGLEPAAGYRLVLESVTPGLAVAVGSQELRTLSKDFRDRMLAATSGIEVVPGSDEWHAIRMLAPVIEESDVPRLAAMGDATSNEALIWRILLCFHELADPAVVPWTARTIARIPSPRCQLRGIEVLRRAGGAAAAAALESICRSPPPVDAPPAPGAQSQGLVHFLQEGARMRAARALGQVDPPRATALFAELSRTPAGRPAAIAGAGSARLSDFETLVKQAADDPPAAALDPDARARLSVMVARHGGAHATRVLSSFVTGSVEPVLERLVATAGLETWGSAECVDPLARDLSEALSAGHPPDPFRAEYRSLRTATAARALGAVLRRSPQAPRARALDAMLRAVREGDPRTRVAALRALGFLADPAAGPALEQERGHTHPEPSLAEMAFALCRSGSPRAGEALDELAASRRPTDLWIAATCAAEMAPAVRTRIWARIQDAARTAMNTTVRRRLWRSMEWLAEHALDASVVWLDGGSYWTRAGLALNPGDRFRIEAHGLLATQRGGAETAADVFGPDGREPPTHASQRVSALIARVGRHEIGAPIDPERVFVAQDAGELVVRLAPANLETAEDSVAECFGAFPTDAISPAPIAGLVVLRAVKMP